MLHLYIVILVSCQGSLDTTDQALLKSIAYANEQLLDDKVNFELEFRCTSSSAGPGGTLRKFSEEHHTYARRFPFTRSTIEFPQSRLDRLLTDSHIYSLVRSKTVASPPQGSVSGLVRNGVFHHWLITHHQLTGQGDNKQMMPLHEALVHPQITKSIQQLRDGGKRVYSVRLDYDNAEYELEFDPERNYLPINAKFQSRRPESKALRTTYRVLESQEIGPGVFFPKRTEGRGFHDDRFDTLVETDFLKAAIGQPIADSVFAWRFPEGTPVANAEMNTVLVADANGVPSSPATRRDGSAIEFLRKNADVEPTKAPIIRLYSTQEEPTAWTAWLLPLACLFFGVAGLLWYWRRRAALGA